MTSNVGSQQIQTMAGDHYDLIKLAVMNEVKGYFRPEFINRIDEVVVFHGLDQANIRAIARIQLKRLEARLDKLELSLQVTDDALDKLAEAGFDPVYGARPLKRAIQNEIENPLARAILAGKYPPKSAIVVDVKDGDIVFA
jgi:ATP-dependent Clp protease ATP-binding subunit ClpB